MKKLKKHLFEVFLLSPAIIYLVGFFIIILAALIKLSLSDVGSSYEVIFPTLVNFKKIFATEEFFIAMKNTIVFVIIGTPLELLAGLILALLINNKFPLRGIVRSIFIIPLAVPAIVTAIIIFILFDFPGGHINHLLQGHYAFIPGILNEPVNFRSSAWFALGISMLGKIWRDMPISMLILLAGLSSIEEDQYEAASSMGASTWQKFRLITMPLLVPSIISVLLLRSIEMWKEFIFPFILAQNYPLLGTFIESLYHDRHHPEEAAVVALVLVICVFITGLLIYQSLQFTRKVLVRV